MFRDRPYAEVNREERFFCFLLGHALLASPAVAQGFKALVARELDVHFGDAPIEVFIEVAALRDYWCDLGDPRVYDAATHASRREVLEAALRIVEVNPAVIDRFDFFWTGVERRKLWSPGRWELAAVKASGIGEKLMPLKWAFNCKPDMMVVGGGNVLMIEAKVESGEGRSSDGYGQYDVQQLVATLMRRLIPAYARLQFRNTTLTLRGKTGLRWRDVSRLVAESDVDAFTRKCFARLPAS